MAERAAEPMTVEQFFRWQEDQDDRYELVDGFPVKMMTGANEFHDAILINVLLSLGNQLRGKPCRPVTADVGVRTRLSSLRRSDITIVCRPPRPNTLELDDPRVLIEVLSKSNHGILWQRKLAEYQALVSVQHILLIDSRSVRATVLTRSGGGWTSSDFDGFSGTISLPAVDCALPMAEIYAGIPEDQIEIPEPNEEP